MWLPPNVSRELRDGTAEYRAEVIQQARTDANLDFWTRELKKLDPYLEMIRARPGATHMREGFYYILRHNPGAPPSLTCIEGSGGEFREPDSSVFDMLRRGDLWNAEANRDRQRLRREALEAEHKRRDVERQARHEELRERWRAVSETSVSMHRTDRPWTQTAGAMRDR